MSNLYQQGGTPDAAEFNANFYNLFVFAKGQYIPFYDSGTTQFVNYTAPVFLINDYVQSLANNSGFTDAQIAFNTGFIGSALDNDAAVAAGWPLG